MSDDSKELSRVEDILSGEDYLPKKPMSRVEELLMDGAMVPKVDDTDNGKVLKVIDGEWQPGDDVSGDNLPPVSSLDNGKVLKVISGEWNIGSDNSDIVVIQLSASYPFSGSKVTLPANINSVLIANYSSTPVVPTYLITSNGVIFTPGSFNKSAGTTPVVQIGWSRMYSENDELGDPCIFIDSLSYNTQNQTTEASYYKRNKTKDSDVVFYQLLEPYPFSAGDTPSLTGINDLIIKYYGDVTLGNDIAPIYLITADGVIFEPGEATFHLDGEDVLQGSISWNHITDYFNSATQETFLYRDSLSYTITYDNPEEATYSRTTIDTLPPVDSGDNGKVLQVAGGKWVANLLPTVAGVPAVEQADVGKVLKATDVGEYDWATDAGGSEAVEIEAADYHALTTAQKEDPTKVYFVKAGRVITDSVSVIPRNPSSSKVDSNTGSASYNTAATYAFDGVMNTPPDTRATSANTVTAWYPGYGNAPESAWASYQFDTATTNLVKLEAYAYNMSTSDPSVTFTTPVIVEGSSDGTNWFNILADGASSFTLSTKETEFVKNEISLDNTATITYIRFRFLNQINGYNDPNFAIAEIYAYTGNVVVYDNSTYYKGIKHGKTAQELPELVAADEGKVLKAVDGKWSKDIVYREITQADYDLLPASKNSDGIIYFITDNS